MAFAITIRCLPGGRGQPPTPAHEEGTWSHNGRSSAASAHLMGRVSSSLLPFAFRWRFLRSIMLLSICWSLFYSSHCLFCILGTFSYHSNTTDFSAPSSLLHPHRHQLPALPDSQGHLVKCREHGEAQESPLLSMLVCVCVSLSRHTHTLFIFSSETVFCKRYHRHFFFILLFSLTQYLVKTSPPAEPWLEMVRGHTAQRECCLTLHPHWQTFPFASSFLPP